MMRKYILLSVCLFGTIVALSCCKKYDEEPQRINNPIFLRYKMPEVEVLNTADQEVVKQIRDEYEKSLK